MHSLIARLLKKRGVKNIDELSAEPMPDGSPTEQETFERYQKILSQDEKITVENIEQFCRKQIGVIEGQWKNLDNTAEKNERLILLHTVYKGFLDMLQSPVQERETLERYLNSLL